MVTGAFFLLVSLFPEVHGFFCQIQTELRADAGGKEKEKEGKRQRKKRQEQGMIQHHRALWLQLVKL